MNIFKWILVGMCKHFPVVINHSVLQNGLAFSRINHSPIGDNANPQFEASSSIFYVQSLA